MPSWIHGLQFRLIVGFVSVLALALASVAVFASYVTQRELDRFEEEVDAARVSRLERVVTETFDSRIGEPRQQLLQQALANAAELFDWRIAVTDSFGDYIAAAGDPGDVSLPWMEGFFLDSHRVIRRPVVVGDQTVAEIWFEAPAPMRGFEFSRGRPRGPADRFGTLGQSPRNSQAQAAQLPISEENFEQDLVEPQFSRLTASFNRSLFWAGLAAAGTGIFVIFITTQRTLGPVRALTGAATALGRGELSRRVPVISRDEVGELSRTFNDMATRLEDAETTRQTMTADVAHELRTPLSNLQGYLEGIRDGVIEPDAQIIGSLHSQVIHLTRLVEDLRLIALMEAGTLRMDLSVDDLSDIAATVADTFLPRAAERKISLSVVAASNISAVNVDRTRISQVIANLVENALTHTPDGGHVEVSTTTIQDRTARVCVTDTGRGIPVDDLGNVFDRLFRVDPSRNRSTGGAGLGLTIVKQLVEAHGGTVSAESPVAEDGTGSRFTVDLPAHGG